MICSGVRRRLSDTMIGPSYPTMVAEQIRPHSYWTNLRGSAHLHLAFGAQP